MSKKSRLFKALTVILSLAILVSSLTVSVFADYSIYKPDGKTFKDNAYIKGNDTAIIYIPGYRCSNLETEFNGKRVVCFAVGTEVFEVSENNSFIENFINGFANLLISGVMLLTNSFRNEDVNVSKNGGFGISDIYVRFFETCVEKYGKESDVIIYDLDWRQDLRITVNDLYSIISAQGYKKVILVTQSMGGLIASGTAKLLRDDLNDENPDNDVDLYTVNVGAAFFGSFDFFYNKTEFKGISKLSPDYFTYKSKVDFPSHAQLGVPHEYSTLYNNDYAVAKIIKADGTTEYEEIAADKAFEIMNGLCQDLDLMRAYYDNYIFVDDDGNPETPAVHIMETLGKKAFYISGTSTATSDRMEIVFNEDENGNRTAVSCNPVQNPGSESGDGVLTAAGSTLSFSSPETTFYVPYDHKSVLFHDDAEHLVYDMLSHIISTPDKDFDYTKTDYEYKDIYTEPIENAAAQSANTLTPQIIKFILGLLGVNISYDSVYKFCNLF